MPSRIRSENRILLENGADRFSFLKKRAWAISQLCRVNERSEFRFLNSSDCDDVSIPLHREKCHMSNVVDLKLINLGSTGTENAKAYGVEVLIFSRADLQKSVLTTDSQMIDCRCNVIEAPVFFQKHQQLHLSIT
jgi:hypothetical protein